VENDPRPHDLLARLLEAPDHRYLANADECAELLESIDRVAARRVATFAERLRLLETDELRELFSITFEKCDIGPLPRWLRALPDLEPHGRAMLVETAVVPLIERTLAILAARDNPFASLLLGIECFLVGPVTAPVRDWGGKPSAADAVPPGSSASAEGERK
jgi:hypothetical protein